MISVALVPEFAAAPDLARVRGGEVVLSDVQPDDRAGFLEFDCLFQDEVEAPLPLAEEEFASPQRQRVSSTG